MRNEGKPQYDAGRRIKWLAAAVLMLVVGLTGAWFFVANRIDQASAEVISQATAAGDTLQCNERAVRGFPFRFGVFCDRVAYASGDGRIALETGALRSAAQFYAPQHAIIEIDAPIVIERPGQPVLTLDYRIGRSSVQMGNAVPQSASVVGEGVEVRIGGQSFAKAERAEAHMRTVDRDMQIAGRGQAFALAELGGQLLIDLDFDVRIESVLDASTGQFDSLRGESGHVDRLALLLSDDRGALLTGPFSVDGQGLISGRFQLRIVDVDGVVGSINASAPQLANLAGLIGSLPRVGEKGDEAVLELEARQGLLSFGLFPIATLPTITF